ncbi:MAG: succinylglutamate desuccinylase/aspartoacylase family protein [Bacteriovoracaceae bacterium]|nr:succinylglutamate desuccinylase/aspartoacylase family protein [Bacteriovoracaceae bacterium]
MKKVFILCLLGIFSCSQLCERSSHHSNRDKFTVIESYDSKTFEPETEASTTLVSEQESGVSSETVKAQELTPKLKKYCGDIEQSFKKYKWGKSSCEDFSWLHVRNSVLGKPLIWIVFGNETLIEKQPMNTTIVMCGVHGDEITPVKFCFDLIHDLQKNPGQLAENELLVVAPIVNPDSFFIQKPTRTNARGVDVNRNFPTKDWNANAIKEWKKRHASDKRRNPGKRAGSEPEVTFQVNLIKRYTPSKIVSVHSPLTIIDYDGPSIRSDKAKDLEHHAIEANELLYMMSEKAKGYKVSNYPHFPGSLGNWAGKELEIPTYTLELPSSDHTKTNEYWETFGPAVHYAIKHDMRMAPKKQAARD